MTTTPARQPKGRPTGGQFAAKSNPEPSYDDLEDSSPPARLSRGADLQGAAAALASALQGQAENSGECPVCHSYSRDGTVHHYRHCQLAGLSRALIEDRSISLSPRALREHWSHLDGESTSMAGATDEDLTEIADAALDSDYLWETLDDVLANARDSLGIESSLGVRVGRGDMEAVAQAARGLGYTTSGFKAEVDGIGRSIEGVVVRSDHRTVLVTPGGDWGAGFAVAVDSPASSSDILDESDVPDTGNTLDELTILLKRSLSS